MNADQVNVLRIQRPLMLMVQVWLVPLLQGERRLHQPRLLRLQGLVVVFDV